MNARAGAEVYKVAPIGDIMSAAYAEIESATTEAELDEIAARVKRAVCDRIAEQDTAGQN